ncbi:desmoplakin isoform X1, partial [Tachysurus ichikawai]
MMPMQQNSQMVYNRCMHNLEKAQMQLEQGGSRNEFDQMMLRAEADIKQLHQFAMEGKSFGQSPEVIIRGLDECRAFYSDLATGAGRTTVHQNRSSTSREEYSISLTDAYAWITQQK